MHAPWSCMINRYATGRSTCTPTKPDRVLDLHPDLENGFDKKEKVTGGVLDNTCTKRSTKAEPSKIQQPVHALTESLSLLPKFLLARLVLAGMEHECAEVTHKHTHTHTPVWYTVSKVACRWPFPAQCNRGTKYLRPSHDPADAQPPGPVCGFRGHRTTAYIGEREEVKNAERKDEKFPGQKYPLPTLIKERTLRYPNGESTRMFLVWACFANAFAKSFGVDVFW
eukprot:1137431-Pelagomonas_calceolata.AAC.8